MSETFELSTAACMATRDSKQCQDFYKTLEQEDQKKKRTCSVEEVTAHLNGAYRGDALLACAAGVIVDPVVALGIGIGEGVAKMEIAWDKATECNKSVDQKLALIMAYNMDVPKLLNYPIPSKEKLQNMPCSALKNSLELYKKVQNMQYLNKFKEVARSPEKKSLLTPEELELMNYNKRIADDVLNKRTGHLAEMVDEMVKGLKLSLECYSPAQALAIKCEIAATIASVAIPSLLAIRMASLAKLTKIRLSKIENYLGELKDLGREGRIVKAKGEIATLSDVEKLKKLEGELGRTNQPLNAKEKAAYEKAHLEGKTGEEIGSYSGNTLREKKRILMEEGGFTEVEADFMINRGYVGTVSNIATRDRTIIDIQEHHTWNSMSGAVKGQAKKVFGRELSDDQTAAVMSYRNARVSIDKEKMMTAAKERMKAQGLSDAEIRAVVSGDFEAGRVLPTVSAPKTTSNPSAAPATAPAQNPIFVQAESNFKNDPVYQIEGKVLNKTEAQKTIDQSARTKFNSDENRAGYVIDSFNGDVEHIQKMKLKAEAATGKEKEKFEATVQVYSKRCKAWAHLYEQAGYSNTNIIRNFKRDIERWCK